jgi:hypothetical protein
MVPTVVTDFQLYRTVHNFAAARNLAIIKNQNFVSRQIVPYDYIFENSFLQLTVYGMGLLDIST